MNTELQEKHRNTIRRLVWLGLFIMIVVIAKHSVSLRGSWFISLNAHGDSGNGWSYQIVKSPYELGASTDSNWRMCDRLSRLSESIIEKEALVLEYPIRVKAESGDQHYKALVRSERNDWVLYVSEFPDMGGFNDRNIACEEWTIYGQFPWMWQLDHWVRDLVTRCLNFLH